MNSLKSFLLFPLVVFSGISSQETTILNQTNIDKKALIIEQKLKRDRFIMYGLTGLSVAHEVYQWVPLLRDLFSKNSSSATEETKLSFFESIKAAAHYLFYTKEGWIAIMQSGVSVGGFFIICEMGKKFIHPNTLRWYINAHAPYDITIKMMQERLVELQDPSLSLEQLRINNEMLHLLYDRLVRQGESMCAFMAYKTKRLDDDEKIVAERSKVLMLKSHNDWLQCINVQLQSDNRDYNVLSTLLDAYKNMIQAQADNFAFIEGETGQERRAIKERKKMSE
jgi:hypothetical protein